MIDETIGKFHRLKDLADRALAQVRDEDLFAALDQESNSLALIAKASTGGKPGHTIS